jgi:hypothetical protein
MAARVLERRSMMRCSCSVTGALGCCERLSERGSDAVILYHGRQIQMQASPYGFWRYSRTAGSYFGTTYVRIMYDRLCMIGAYRSDVRVTL